MADIQFQEPQYRRPFAIAPRSWLSNLVMRLGLAKDYAGAQKVLLIVAILAVVVAAWLAFSGGPDVRGPIPKGTSLTVPG